MLDEISDITTKHDYNTGKTILHIINTQGGQNDLIGRDTARVQIQKMLNVLSTIIQNIV